MPLRGDCRARKVLVARNIARHLETQTAHSDIFEFTQPLVRRSQDLQFAGYGVENHMAWPLTNRLGELVKKAIITVVQNGVVVQDHYELTGCTDGIGAVPWKTIGNYERKHPPEVFIGIQGDHAPGVRFRNIWVRELN